MISCVLLVVLKYADHFWRCQSVELSVDDLRTGRGVVLGRAVPMLRSVETQPLTGGFVLMDGRILIGHLYTQIHICVREVGHFLYFFHIFKIFSSIFYITFFLSIFILKNAPCPYNLKNITSPFILKNILCPYNLKNSLCPYNLNLLIQILFCFIFIFYIFEYIPVR